MKRFAPLIVGLVVAMVCVRLGVWQLERLQQRRERNAQIAVRLELPPLQHFAIPAAGAAADPATPISAAPAAAAAPAPYDYRRAVATGRFDFSHQLVVMARSLRGAPGVHVVTPLIADSLVVLVERGWAASPNAKDVDLGALVEAESTEVEGVLLPSTGIATVRSRNGPWPRFVRTPSSADVAGVYRLPVLDHVLRRTDLTSAPPGLQAAPLPELTSGPHLAYAVQWLSFAVIALVGGTMLWRHGGSNDRRQ